MLVLQHSQSANLPPRHLTRQMRHGAQSVDESNDHMYMSTKVPDDNYNLCELGDFELATQAPSLLLFLLHLCLPLEDLQAYVNISTTKMSVLVRTEKSGTLRPSHPSIIVALRHILKKEFQAVSVDQKPANSQLLEPRKSITQTLVTPSIFPPPKPRKPPIQSAPNTRAPTIQSLSPSHTNLPQPPGGNISTSLIPSPTPSPRPSKTCHANSRPSQPARPPC